MTPTRKRLLFAIGAVGLLCGITASRSYLALAQMLLAVRPTTPIAIAVMCGALFWWTLIVRRRLLHIARAKHEAAKTGTPFRMQERPLDPIVAARTVALAFAASRVGSYVCGFYAGVALTLVGHLAVIDARWSLGNAVATVVFSFLLIVVALWLERSCKLPPTQLPSAADAIPSG
jgi:hypothetical protein